MRPWTHLAALALAAAAAGAGGHDGRRSDPGAGMTSRAPGAPEPLERLAGRLGQWRIERVRPAADGSEEVTGCDGEVTFFNRGHGLMERLHCPAGDGGDAFDRIALLVFDAGTALWVLGEADSWTESVRLASGELDGEALVLIDADRPSGGSRLVHRRITAEPTATGWEVRREVSSDGQRSWELRSLERWRRREPTAGFMAARSELGAPDPSLPDEARAFDFLVGHWTMSHAMTFPNGQTVQWTSTTEAVHVLGGRAVMEFDWFDADPNLPDAATTIVRVYNRAMRRWECLYAANRAGTLLHFGGRQEGDRIVLHSFATDSSAPSIPRYVFHGIGDDAYHWYAETSFDRGATFTKSWIIDARRVAETPADGGP